MKLYASSSCHWFAGAGTGACAGAGAGAGAAVFLLVRRCMEFPVAIHFIDFVSLRVHRYFPPRVLALQEVRPGIVTKDKTGAVCCMPIFSRIEKLLSENNDLQVCLMRNRRPVTTGRLVAPFYFLLLVLIGSSA